MKKATITLLALSLVLQTFAAIAYAESQLKEVQIREIQKQFNFNKRMQTKGRNGVHRWWKRWFLRNANGANLLSKLQSAGASVKVIPYDFYLSACSNSSNAYWLDSKIEIRLRTTSYLTKLNTSVFRFDDESNRVQYVLGSVTQSNKTSIFRFNSRGGDIYAVAVPKMGFVDTGSHWARAFGLESDSDAAGRFRDISSNGC